MILHRPDPSARLRGLRFAVPIAALAVTAAACGGGTGGSGYGSSSGGAADSTPPSAASSSTASTGSGSAGNGYGGYVGGGGGSGSSGAATVSVAGSGALGKVLVDGRGRTLYLFEQDAKGRSTCFGPCAGVWPPLTSSGAAHVGGTAKASLLGTDCRRDGKTQVTYQGHPLYFYQGDSKPGQANGEGLKQFGAEWYAVSAAGSKVQRGGS